MNKTLAIAALSAILGSSAMQAAVPAMPVTVGHRTEALPADLWSCSQWIAVPGAPEIKSLVNEEHQRAADGASWFATTLKNDRKVKKAVWMTTGLGVYQLYVNGKPVGEEVLRPGFTHIDKTRRSFTYDITDAINRKSGAENTLSVQSTPGWWADRIVTSDNPNGMKGGKPAFRSVVEITYDDGSTVCVGTDPSWKAAIAGPVTHAGIYDGEAYDDRIPMGYETISSFGNAEPYTRFNGEILPSAGGEIYTRPDLMLQPVDAYVWEGISGADDTHYGKVNITRRIPSGKKFTVKPGETLVVDFGQNAAAIPVFEFSAPEGTKLECCFAEILNDGNGAHSRGMDGPEGSAHMRNLRIYDKGMLRLDYIFGHNGKMVTYKPDCTFYGYRYLSLTADRPVTIKSVESLPVTSIAAAHEIGRITTGNADINKLISNTRWGQLSNYLSVPTDCPQRNERLGWTADTQVFTETGSFFANTRDFFHKWTRDLRDNQHPDGGYPGVAPGGIYGANLDNETSRFGWSDAGVIVPYTIWKQFADTAIVNQNWEAMMKYMKLLDRTGAEHENLIPYNGDFQWGDWLSYEPLESCGGGINHVVDGKVQHRPEAREYWAYLQGCYWISNAEMMAEMARATGRDDSRLKSMAQRARDYVKARHLNDDGTFRCDILNTMQTPALFAMRNKLVEGKNLENMKQRLRDNFASHGNCLQTGFLGTSILLPTLTENGMVDIAYELLLQRKNPSWLYSVDNGATTIWERWNSYTLDKGMGEAGMNSFNHYAYGVVCQWIWNTMAGIQSDPAQPGFRHIIMKPIPDKRIGSLKAEYASTAGLIKSEWKYDGDLCTWNFTIPEGSTATVTLPVEGATPKEYTAGTYTLTF